MSIWDTYEARATINGRTVREQVKNREIAYLKRKVANTLSYFEVSIVDSVKIKPGLDRNIEEDEIHNQQVAIINSDNHEIKTIISMPGEDIRHGDIVEWMDNHWLITEKDYNTELYTKCVMQQCNYLLRWIDDKGEMYEQWVIVEDGTKYLTGEFVDRDFVLTRGDSRIAITMPRSLATAKLGRATRFLVDEPMTSHMLAYSLSKPLKLGATYGNDGVYKFVLQEVATSDYDNFDLRVADYYKYFEKVLEEPILPPPENDPIQTIPEDDKGKRLWL